MRGRPFMRTLTAYDHWTPLNRLESIVQRLTRLMTNSSNSGCPAHDAGAARGVVGVLFGAQPGVRVVARHGPAAQILDAGRVQAIAGVARLVPPLGARKAVAEVGQAESCARGRRPKRSRSALVQCREAA